MNEQQIRICAYADVAARYGNAISVDPELEADAEELLEKGWLRAAEGEKGEVGYAITDLARMAMDNTSEN